MASNTCQMCGGPLEVLGVLGWLKHLRCRNCGAQYSRTARKKKRKGVVCGITHGSTSFPAGNSD